MAMRADITIEIKPWVMTLGRIELDELRAYVELKDVSADTATTISKFSWSWKSVEELEEELPRRLEEIWGDWCKLIHAKTVVQEELRKALERRGVSHILEVRLVQPYEGGEGDS